MSEVLAFDRVERTYPGPPTVTALHACTVHVAAGQFVTISGPSGSGKSTWLHLAGLLDRPTSGEVYLNSLATSPLRERHRTALRATQLGFVFQSFFLLPGRTVLENIELQGVYQHLDPRRRREQALGIVERVRLSHRTDAMAGQLSGGEMQRVAIGRALMGSPSLLLCDEPTGNLDSRNGAQVMDLLTALNESGVAVVVITHDPGIAAMGQQRLVAKDGWMTREQ
ncbi:ABC transporter ATP-binding protein [Acidipropionibacterium timonense]|uniref:ABC transporter ATP-binding protein n=1 Tax=Acidipropionibacterium timonense TaxID=2161818 RepID=UPI001031A8C4|nr:ABC transporter ATP-binding protein [Acidipropionibacterium timonense]